MKIPGLFCSMLIILKIEAPYSAYGYNPRGNRGHELAVQAQEKTRLAYESLKVKATMQQEFTVVHGRINELQTAVVEVLAPQAVRIANATESLAFTAYNLSLSISESLGKFNTVIDEMYAGMRLILAILLLICCALCQTFISCIGNTLKPNIMARVTKHFMYLLQLFC